MPVAWQMLSRARGPQALGAERFPAPRTQAPQRWEAWAEHWLPDSRHCAWTLLAPTGPGIQGPGSLPPEWAHQLD